MRILFTTIRAMGHFRPLVPLAKELQRQGHDVRFAAIDRMTDAIGAEGFAHMMLDGPTDAERDEIEKRMSVLPPMEASRRYVPEVFMGVLARIALPGLVTSLQDWRPDLIVRESCEFSGLVAAEKLGIPCVRVEVLNGESEENIATRYHAELDGLRAGIGLPPLGPGSLRGEPAFSAHPAVLDSTARVNTQMPFRYIDAALPRADTDTPRPEWLPKADAPLIYATFGTVAAGIERQRGIYQLAVAAFEGLPVHVLLTTGHDAPEGMIPDPPSNVTIRDFVPQAEVLPHAALMVCHGGSGTVVSALAAGVPMVICPLFADQPDNASCLAARGLCLSLPEPTPATLSAAIVQALADGALRARCAAAAQHIAKIPDVRQAADALLAMAEIPTAIA